jgi:putative CocE/NonD family hydrolase
VVGPVTPVLYVSTSGSDADFVVKLIDVFPQDSPEVEDKHLNVPMGGYQMLVRGEVMRGKFRSSYSEPSPLVSGEVATVRFDMPDVAHTFKTGHRIMIQIQSSWFPLVDRNPQTFVDIYNAKETDFQEAIHQVYRSAKSPTHVIVNVLEN